MRVTSVELHPANSSAVCVLSFRDPGRVNPYNVKSITGLDADEIVSRFYRGSGSTTKFYNLSLEKKDISVLISLNPSFETNETYSILRDNLYKIISSSRTGSVEVQFKDGETVVASVSGLVKKFEATHFDKEPQVQLTISCDDPMLRAPTPVVVNAALLNEANANIQDLFSTAPHGFQFTIFVINPVASIRITDPLDLTWEFVVTPVGGFLANDVLHFSSERNDKQLYLTRGATTIYLADVISPISVWPILFPGDNTFALDNPTKLTWTSVQFRPTYWGV